jgi:TolB-like protein/tetratricopeptide (TPR) repeat protein
MIVIGIIYWVNRGETLGGTTFVENTAFPLPDNPAIAVLPFSNLSGDTRQEYFSDGITNDIITDLSQVSNLLVIASNSVFVYKNNPVKVQQVAQDLGVTHVLEGSVQKSGNQVRINAQLIDAISGHHLWAERFDRELVDIFKLQDEVSRKIVDTLAVKLTSVEQRLLDRDRPADPQAYDMLLQGLEHLRRFTRNTNAEARRYFEEAIQFDPGFARAYADVAFSHAMDFLFGWEEASDEKFRVAFEYADKAVALDDTIGQVHFARGVLYLTAKDHASAIESAFRAVATNPNYADGWANVSQVLVYSGKPEESLEKMSIAKELNPRYAFFYTWIEGHARMLLGEHEAAEEAFLDVIERNPHFPGAHLTLASLYGNLGRTDEAEWAALEILSLNPQFSIAGEAARVPYKLKQHHDYYITGLRKAGLPE